MQLRVLLVAARALVGPLCLASSLAGFLKGLHGLVVLLHGLLSSQQEQVQWLACMRVACRLPQRS
jgi:hypothetical protein